MKTRLLTALFGIPFLILCLVVRGWLAELMVVLLSLIAVTEYYQALRAAKYDVCTWGGYFAVALMWPLSRFMGVLDPLLLLLAAMGVTFVGIFWRKNPTFPDAAASVYPLFTCLLPMSMFLMMVNKTFGTVPGVALITMAFGIAYGTDSAAFIGGKTLGKHKLCPVVSPKKTVEGAIAGLFGGMLVAVCVRSFFVYVPGWPMPRFSAALALGLIGSVVGQVGDLTASLLKRHSGIKDYGKVFPGHGGVMDRFDSTIFVLIVMYCYTLLLK